jgi:catechol 2,3-dioxygenase-like lactoylglutathione lyase family enzyme
MTLDFYVRVLGMPIVHGLRTPSRPAGASHSHGNGAPPHSNVPHYFCDMGGDSLLAFLYPKRIAKVDRDAIGAMQHVSFACGPRRYHEILERLKADGVTINAGPLLVIPPAIHSFYFLIRMASGSKSPLTSSVAGFTMAAWVASSARVSPSSPKAGTEGSNPAPSTAESATNSVRNRGHSLAG